MIGINAGYAQRGRVQPRSGEGLHVEAVSGAARQRAAGVHVDENGGNLQQRIGARIEATGLNIDHHGQKAAETAAHESSDRGGA